MLAFELSVHVKPLNCAWNVELDLPGPPPLGKNPFALQLNNNNNNNKKVKLSP
jgi:hypothetical protein